MAAGVWVARGGWPPLRVGHVGSSNALSGSFFRPRAQAVVVVEVGSDLLGLAAAETREFQA